MNPEDDKAVESVYLRAANGSLDALNFLRMFHHYCHAIDDLIDDKQPSPEKLLALLAQANLVYSMPFYKGHAGRLHLIVAHLTNAYADSIDWGKSRENWKVEWADKLRFAGNDMILAVALIEGGFSLMRELSPLVKELSWWNHHDNEGKAD